MEPDMAVEMCKDLAKHGAAVESVTTDADAATIHRLNEKNSPEV